MDADLLSQYRESVHETTHLNAIQEVAALAERMDHDGVLSNGRYRLGISQKLVNLQLKYLWCLGVIPEPPHCPVDRIVLARTKLRNRLNWTQIDSVDSYLQAIKAIRALAHASGLSIARWELANYDRRG